MRLILFIGSMLCAKKTCVSFFLIVSLKSILQGENDSCHVVTMQVKVKTCLKDAHVLVSTD